MCEGSKIQLHFKIPSLKRKKVEIFITANEMEGGKMQQIVLIFHIFFYSCDELFLVKVKHIITASIRRPMLMILLLLCR